jgi:CMP-N-acetylneuraminic acid synthetase
VLPVSSPEHPSQLSSIVVIPARYESTRFPGKPLALLAGRPMIEHVYRRAIEARGVSRVLVATDDERIAEAVRRFGGEAVMTRRRIPRAPIGLRSRRRARLRSRDQRARATSPRRAEMIEQAIAPFADDEHLQMTVAALTHPIRS